MVINPTEHYLVPKHTIMTDEETTNLIETKNLNEFLLDVIKIPSNFSSLDELKTTDYLSFVYDFLNSSYIADKYIIFKDGNEYCETKSIEKITADAFGKPFPNHDGAAIAGLSYKNGVYDFVSDTESIGYSIKNLDIILENGIYVVNFDIFGGYMVDDKVEEIFICKAESKIRMVKESMFQFNVVSLKRDLLPEQWLDCIWAADLLKDKNRIVFQQGNWIYYVDSNSFGMDNYIFKIHTDGTNKTKLCEDDNGTTIQSMKVVGDWIYFINSMGAEPSLPNNLIKIRTDGTSRTIISEDTHIFEFDIKAEWIFYKRPSDDWNGDIPDLKYSIYKMRTDGTEKQFVNQVS